MYLQRKSDQIFESSGLTWPLHVRAGFLACGWIRRKMRPLQFIGFSSCKAAQSAPPAHCQVKFCSLGPPLQSPQASPVALESELRGSVREPAWALGNKGTQSAVLWNNSRIFYGWSTYLAQGHGRLQCGWLGLKVSLFLEELESREMGPEAGGKPAVPWCGGVGWLTLTCKTRSCSGGSKGPVLP